MQINKWGVPLPLLTDKEVISITIDAYATLPKPERGTLYSNPFASGTQQIQIEQILIGFQIDSPHGTECEYTYEDRLGDGSDEIFFELERNVQNE